METRLAIRYTGSAVDSGQMDVYEASANMIAFSEFVVLAAKAAFGPSVSAKAEVAGFGRGSFLTDLVFQVVGASASVFAAASPELILDRIKEAIDIWKHLKGEQPKVVESDGNFAKITNNNGQLIQVQTQSLQLVFSEKGAETVGQFVRKALEKQGMDTVEISSGTNLIEKVTQSESYSFVPVAPYEKITDVVIRMGLILEAPMFKDGLKWRFSDGMQYFYADIDDKEFSARVDAGGEIRKGRHPIRRCSDLSAAERG